MRLGEFDHGVESGTEGLARREVKNVHGKTALAVNVDGRLFNDRVVGTPGRRSVVGSCHSCTADAETLSGPYIAQSENEDNLSAQRVTDAGQSRAHSAWTMQASRRTLRTVIFASDRSRATRATTRFPDALHGITGASLWNALRGAC